MNCINNINRLIKTNNVNLIYLDICDSTNKLMKELAENGANEKTVIISREQTAGRGRLGRTFYSPGESGLYMSILLRPDINPENALEITTAAGIAMVRVLEKYVSGQIGIKWVNDIYVDFKKVCGILTESSLDTDGKKLKYAILGIGANLFLPKSGFPDDIKDIAASVFESSPDSDIFCKITAEIIDTFFSVYELVGKKELIDEYRRYSVIIGKDVIITAPNGKTHAKVIGINDDYSLSVILENGEHQTVNSGDVSIRIKKK